MQYIHASSIGSNGNLKSTNCVVDSRWVVKITDIGIVCPGRSTPFVSDREKKLTEDDYYGGEISALLSTNFHFILVNAQFQVMLND